METLQRVGVAPIGMAEIDGVFTEHIEIPNPAGRHEAVVEKLELVEPVAEQAAPRPILEERIDRVLATIATSTVEPSPELPLGEPGPARTRPRRPRVKTSPELPFGEPGASIEEPATLSEALFADLGSVVVEVGDLVFIRYDDQPEHAFSVRLSDTINNPNEGIVHVERAPLGAAILGASVDEQITVRIGNGTRTAVIEKIEKAREALLAAE
jgi:hypothetical protein